MNYRMIVKLLCSVLRIVAGFMIPAAIISFCNHEMPTFWGFIITMAVMLLLSLTTFVFPAQRKTFYAREAFVLASLTWLMVSAARSRTLSTRCLKRLQVSRPPEPASLWITAC